MGPAIRKGLWVVGVCAVLVLCHQHAAAAGTDKAFSVAPQCAAVLKANTSPRPAGSPQAQHDPRTNAAFFLSLTADQAVRMTATAQGLSIEKKVYRDGHFQIVLKAGEDVLTVATSRFAVDVTRGKRQMRVQVAEATENELLQLQTLLAGSRALRSFRTLASSLDPTTLETPAGSSIVLSDAFLGFLNGDVSAVARLRRNIQAAAQAKLRPVAFALAGGNDCWEKYLQEVMLADKHYWECSNYYRWWDPRQEICGLGWVLETESAWFQFIACSAVPLRVE